MKPSAWIFAAAAMSLSSSLMAEVCLTGDGYIVECPGTIKVASHFQLLPTRINEPVDIYVTGGGTITGMSGFQIRANKQFLCDTGIDGGGFSSATPIRHCIGTISVPGTYTFDAMPYGGGNFGAPSPTTVNVF